MGFTKSEVHLAWRLLQSRLSRLRDEIGKVDQGLESAYRNMMLYRQIEALEHQATFREDGHVLSYRRLYRFNRDFFDPLVEHLEAEKEKRVEEYFNLAPPAEIIKRWDYPLYIMLKKQYPQLNRNTKVEDVPYYGPRIAYSVYPIIYAISPDGTIPPMAYPKIETAEAEFLKWAWDGHYIATLAFAPELNTLFSALLER